LDYGRLASSAEVATVEYLVEESVLGGVFLVNGASGEDGVFPVDGSSIKGGVLPVDGGEVSASRMTCVSATKVFRASRNAARSTTQSGGNSGGSTE
jgi:hypothetical protein